MTQYRVDFRTMTWETPVAGVRSKAYKQGTRKLRLVEFTKEFVEPDWCTKGHIGYVLDGRVEINFGGRAIVFGQGDGLFISAGEEHKHAAKVLTDKVKMILVEDV